MSNQGTASGRASKKVRRREDEPPDDGRDEEMRDNCRQKNVSFKDAVLNNILESSKLDNEWEAENLELHSNDVHKVVLDGIPTIDFSEWVYNLIDESMSKTLMIKLLGRKIGFNALWSKVCALWKPMNRFKLMDIENDYYLAKF